MTSIGIATLMSAKEAYEKELCRRRAEARGNDELYQSGRDRAWDRSTIAGDDPVRASQYATVLRLLADAWPVPPPTQTEHVQLGHFVTLGKFVDDTEVGEVTYFLGGEDEPSSYETVQTIGIASPLGQRLLGKEVGDLVELTTPRGIQEYEIRSIVLPCDAAYKMKNAA